MDKKVGHYAFIGAVILAIVVAIVNPMIVSGQLPADPYQNLTQWLITLMVVFGLIVGHMNIDSKQKKDFLMVATMLIIAAGFGGAANILGGIMYVGQYLSGIFQGIVAITVPAMVVVLLKDVWTMCQNK